MIESTTIVVLLWVLIVVMAMGISYLVGKIVGFIEGSRRATNAWIKVIDELGVALKQVKAERDDYKRRLWG